MRAPAIERLQRRNTPTALSANMSTIKPNLVHWDKLVPKPRKWIRLRTMCLEYGLEYLMAPRQERKLQGQWVESTNKGAKTRLQMFKNGQTSCVRCGLEGSHWHIERAVNDHVMPFSINLYGMVGYEEVMLTHDHVLPKSLGGSNNVVNAQCMCDPCNHKKANFLKLNELISIAGHEQPMLIHKFDMNLTRNLRSSIAEATEEFEKLRAYVRNGKSPTNSAVI